MKYLLYALGEIVLVMIGILLALQVNNLNENRKDRIAEQALYKFIIGSLESDLEDVNSKIILIDKAIKAQEIFITHELNEAVEKNTISELQELFVDLSWTSRSFFPNYGLYSKISGNNQIDLIQSHELQMEIMELYEQLYKRYSEIDLNLEQQMIYGLHHKVYSNYMDDIILERTSSPEKMVETYDVLRIECRKIYIGSKSVKESMEECQEHIVSLLVSLKEKLIVQN